MREGNFLILLSFEQSKKKITSIILKLRHIQKLTDDVPKTRENFNALKQAIRSKIKTNRLFNNFLESMWSFALVQ